MYRERRATDHRHPLHRFQNPPAPLAPWSRQPRDWTAAFPVNGLLKPSRVADETAHGRHFSNDLPLNLYAPPLFVPSQMSPRLSL